MKTKKILNDVHKEVVGQMKVFEQALNWLLSNVNDIDDDDTFDFPYYVGMPKSIYERLSIKQVEVIQNYWDELFVDPESFVTDTTSELWLWN